MWRWVLRIGNDLALALDGRSRSGGTGEEENASKNDGQGERQASNDEQLL